MRQSSGYLVGLCLLCGVVGCGGRGALEVVEQDGGEADAIESGAGGSGGIGGSAGAGGSGGIGGSAGAGGSGGIGGSAGAAGSSGAGGSIGGSGGGLADGGAGSGPDAGDGGDSSAGSGVGQPCMSALECVGNFCIPESYGFVDGYCSQYGCDLDEPEASCEPYGGDGYCVASGSTALCMDRCDPLQPDCREAYYCQPIGGGEALCLPSPVCGNGNLEFGEECEPPGTPTCDATCHGYGDSPVGASCATAGDCAGDWCINEWPGGYCSELECDLATPATSCIAAGGDGYCYDNGTFGVCLDRCNPSQPDCRAEYDCVALPGGLGLCIPTPACGNGTVEFGEECEPPGTSTCNDTCQGTGQLEVGEACTQAAQCAGNYCIAGWPSGYCSEYGCDTSTPAISCAEAGGDGYCIDVGDGGNPLGICLDSCNTLSPDCRSGYDCKAVAPGVAVCMPTPECGNGIIEYGEECEPPSTAACDASCQGLGTLPVGEACEAATECAGNYCIDWPDGYCSSYGCDPAAPEVSCEAAGGDGICIDVGEWGKPLGACLDQCDPSAPDCRSSYTCQDFGGGSGLCLPTPVCGDGKVDFGEECEPPGSVGCGADCQGTGKAEVGQACTAPTDCAGNQCIDGWPAGYCSQVPCDLSSPLTSCAQYGGDGMCVDMSDAGPPMGICLDRCQPLLSNCRTGYDCVRVALTIGLCLPEPSCGNGVIERGEECEPPGTASCNAACQGPGTAPTGTACTHATECAGNLCFDSEDGWAGGYCSQVDCDPLAANTSCKQYGANAVCGVLELFGPIRIVCLQSCQNTSDCRPGYQCGWAGAVRACIPS